MGSTHFAGFPDGRLEATVIPSLFFSELLREFDDLSELKLILYVFWRLGKKKDYPRLLTWRELDADPTIRAGLATPGSHALESGLDRLVNRGILLRRKIELNGTPEECYFLNTTSGRRAVRDLESGRLDLGHVVLPEAIPERRERPNVFELYEQNIGLLTPLIVDELREAEHQYPEGWIEEAFRQAVAYNRRSWRYVQRILERWAVEGRNDEAPRRRPQRARNP